MNTINWRINMEEHLPYTITIPTKKLNQQLPNDDPVSQIIILKNWCMMNCIGSYDNLLSNKFIFSNKDDAAFFKLTWG